MNMYKIGKSSQSSKNMIGYLYAVPCEGKMKEQKHQVFSSFMRRAGRLS